MLHSEAKVLGQDVAEPPHTKDFLAFLCVFPVFSMDQGPVGIESPGFVGRCSLHFTPPPPKKGGRKDRVVSQNRRGSQGPVFAGSSGPCEARFPEGTRERKFSSKFFWPKFFGNRLGSRMSAPSGHVKRCQMVGFRCG